MFETESDLVGFFIKDLKKKKNRKIITELTTNFGRPDIVEMVYIEKIFSKRKKYLEENNCPSIDRVDTYILTFLYGKSWINKITILKALNINMPTLERALNRLLVRGIVEKKDDKIKMKPKAEVLAISQINVYEAKLSNWKYVIEQAERHFWFSNNSSILLPDLSNGIIEHCKEECSKQGVGLLVADGKKVFNLNGKSIKKNKNLINTPLLWELNENILDGRI